MLEHIDKIEKSNVMEDHYQKSDDPWGNREFGIYRNKLDKAIKDSYDLVGKKHIKVYDVGVGGGSVLDAFLKNQGDYEVELSGGDISPAAINYINKNYEGSYRVIDYEEYDSSEPDEDMQEADIISFIDVMYYFDTKRYYKRTLDQLWESFSSGTIVLVADTLIPYQRRSYYGTFEDSELLEDFTDYNDPLDNNGKKRNLKVKIYRKRAPEGV